MYTMMKQQTTSKHAVAVTPVNLYARVSIIEQPEEGYSINESYDLQKAYWENVCDTDIRIGGITK